MEDVGDLYLDVSDAFHDNGYYSVSKPLLERLISSQHFNTVMSTPLSSCLLIYHK